jgi:hypothetical protein
MLGVSTTVWWAIGYGVGGAVVLVAAALLVAIILLARRIVRQAIAITYALDGAMRNTIPLFDVANVNHTIESVTRGLEKARGEPKGIEDERSLLQRVRGRRRGGGGR